MNTGTVSRIVALGALTGVRSMAGLATLASAHGGAALRLTAIAAAAEMIVDKTSFVGNRIDPLPLAGRAAMGAVVGGLVASHRERRHVILGGLLGAATAIAAAHLAYQVRTRVPLPNVAGGLLEDGLVAAVGYRLA